MSALRSRQHSFSGGQASRPLNIKQGSVEVNILFSNEIWNSAEQLREEFSLIPLPESIVLEELTAIELISLFLSFSVDRAESDDIQSFYPVVRVVFFHLRDVFLKKNDVHAATKNLSLSNRNVVIKAYFYALSVLRKEGILFGDDCPAPSSALFNSVRKNEASMFAIFGGQGNSEEYFEELVELYNNYKNIVHPFISKMSNVLRSHALSKEATVIHSKGLNVLRWLQNPETKPDIPYLISAPVSLPMIGLIQLTHYLVTLKVLDISADQLRNHFKGATGHSQGIISAVVIASSSNEESFYENSEKALGLLFWIGARSQQTYPQVTLNPSILKDSIANGEGNPSVMLAIYNLHLPEVQKYVKSTNQHLPLERQIHINLINGPRSIICVGHPQSLHGLNLTLRKIKAPTGLDQSRIPHSQRKQKFSSRFLPITAPFHSDYLAKAPERIVKDIEYFNLEFHSKDLAIPILSTLDGKDLTNSENLTKELIDLICIHPIHWEKATEVKSLTHIVDFGPGGTSGIGGLTYRNKEGTGVQVILAGTLQGNNPNLSYKSDLFDNDLSSVKYAPNWGEAFKPKLVKIVNTNKILVDTRFSRLIGKPPLMVPGMTPSTVPSKFVSAVINAGYHVELAGGGHFSEPMFRDKIKDIMAKIQPGESITVNILFLNAFQWGFQFPLVQQMKKEGYPIEGICCAAGTPSLDVANDIVSQIKAAGLKHISFKPGSVSAIRQVVQIASNNPDMPIILQWTGGRAGGHHSFEDFHQPILETYSLIRQHDNIILIAGSGFGSHEDTLPYLTGEWSFNYDYPSMPFDGVLFGSRVMVALESEADDQVKKSIVNAQGVDDKDWENTYTKETGGILTVKSELGEPIHKVANRGIRFWKEMDETVFNLPKNKRQTVLDAKKDYIIKRLNEDFQKVWFGKKQDGTPADLEDLTYSEVVNRLIELCYIKHQNRWIDITLRRFVGDFMIRIEERFISQSKTSLLQDYNQIQEPFEFIKSFLDAYPESYKQLLTTEDVQYFLTQCLRRDQKPVPFIPVLDSNLEFWFKKDSLWQSEDLQAVPGQDVDRTAILHGPIAAKHSTEYNVPVKTILDDIHNGHINALLNKYYDNDETKIPTMEYIGGTQNNYPDYVPKDILSINDPVNNNTIIYETNSNGNLPSTNTWLELISGPKESWLRAILTSPLIVQNNMTVKNPLLKVFRPRNNQRVIIQHNESNIESLKVYEGTGKHSRLAIMAEIQSDNNINVIFYEKKGSIELPLVFPYLYKPEQGYAPIHEVMTGRNDRIKDFYYKLWFNSDEYNQISDDPNFEFITKGEQVSREEISKFCQAVGNQSESYVDRGQETLIAPVDFAIVVGWKAIIKCIFPKFIDGDLLKLVHLSNGFRLFDNVKPLQSGDIVDTHAKITALVNNESGKLVQVKGVVKRDGQDIIEVNSQFLYRGKFEDFEYTFKNVEELPMEINLPTSKDVAVLKSKSWFIWEREDVNLIPNSTLTFRLTTHSKFKSANIYSELKTFGSVYMTISTKEVVKVATVNYISGESHGNPVMEYLQRIGKSIDQATLFENGGYSIMLKGDDFNSSVQTPSTNFNYAQVSQDLNPIHVNPYFSDLADLPGTITHGMWSSASTRKFVETFAADNKPLRVTSYKVNFQGMVLPGDQLTTNLFHIGMQEGKKVIKVETINQHNDKVLDGIAEVEQPSTAYVFTGQGSQEVGMGMALYDSSPVARAIWDQADSHYLKNYGFSILDIVRNNPKERTIHFGGLEGKKIRKNYISMTYDKVDEDDTIRTYPLFPQINESSTSFTFIHPAGLLSATQFTQPALTLVEKAAFEDMKAKGLVQHGCAFAGHSLGEYAALAAIGKVLHIESVIDLVFYRGMTMQSAVQRDSLGRSNFGMVAVNPSRVSKSLNETYLKYVVDAIAHQSNSLLQIVNYNVENWQYVVSGELTNLETLANVLNYMKTSNIDLANLMKTMTIEQVKEHLTSIISVALDKAKQKKIKSDGYLVLERGYATIPLPGIDVPFHSHFLLSGVSPFRSYILQKINPSNIDVAHLTGRYIPNLTAIPYSVTKEYFECVFKVTNSSRINKVLKNWDEQTTFNPAQLQQLGYILLVELLAYQFASPVRWIETQDQLFKNFGVERLIEIGPSPTLSGMADRTLKFKYAAYDDALNLQRASLCCTKNEKEIYYIQDPEDEEVATPTTETKSTSEVKPATPASAPAPAAAPVARGPVQALDDVPVNAIDILHVIIAQKLKKELSGIPLSKAIKDLVGGKSTLQNEILGDLQKEFGNNVPEKPEETPLEELGAQLAPGFSGNLGKHTSGLISKLAASKLPGGFTQSNARSYLSSTYGLGNGRTDAVLLIGLTKEPTARLASEQEAKAWLDSIAQVYASHAKITLSTGGVGSDSGAGSAGGAVIDSAEFNALTKKQNDLYKRQIQLLAQYLGEDQYITTKLLDEEKARTLQLQGELDLFQAEHGDEYIQSIKPVFDSKKVRIYNSYWNWSRQDAINLYYDFVFGRLTAVDRDVTAQCLHLMNRADPTLLDFMKYHIDNCPIEKGGNYITTKEFGKLLIENVEASLNNSPIYKDVTFPTAPSTQITEKGDIIYNEVQRANVRKLAHYVNEMAKGSKLTEFSGREQVQQNLGRILKIVQHQPRIKKAYKDEIKSLYQDISKSLTLNQSGVKSEKSYKVRRPINKLNGIKKQENNNKEQLPFLFLKKKDHFRGWEYNAKLTSIYLEALTEMCNTGLSLVGKKVLVTGCGRKSIGSEILCALLSGGAQVIVTTSRFNRSATEYFQGLYQRYGAKGSSLIVLPLNQGSKQDIENLINYIYNTDEKAGLNWDLDCIIPFAAVPENGREITDIDGRSEFAHRVMLTNLIRLLGCVKTKKESLGYHTRPAQVIVPLSPNHGIFGSDGLYSESKLSLENLMNRWYAESWGSYLTIVGCVIGWTRGTGLMEQNNIVCEGLEKFGVRTFSTQEMAFNILGLLHPNLVDLAQINPVWADLNGGFQQLPNFKQVITSLRQQIMETASIRQAISADNALDFSIINGAKVSNSYQTRTSTPKANIKFNFPQLKPYDEIKKIQNIQGMLDLEKVVVVTGFAEVGPWGNARTRWEMEAYGEFSLEGCIEMAWIMGLIKHHNGPLKTGQQYTGWVDAKANTPVPDNEVKKLYEEKILEHTGIRLIEPELFHGYDPNARPLLREVVIDQDLEPMEVSAEEAAHFKHKHGDKVEIYEIKETGSWLVRFRKGSSIYVPKALRHDRLVAGQIPTGWDPLRYGIPEDIVAQVDRITLFVLVSTVEALVSSGITDPYEFYKYVHVTEVGNTAGSGMGGMVSLRRMYKERFTDQPVQMDILQETFINTMPAWVNLLLLSSSGPIKTPVGACATAVESVEIGVDTIVSGKAKVVIVGGYDDFHEEGSTEFANMKATSNSIEEFAKGRTPKEMSRPTTSTRAGFMESQGSGIEILMTAKLAIEMGVPIYGIVALTNTATDKEGRSVPAPGQGILTTARECPGKFKSPLLDIKYRSRQIEFARTQIKSWVEKEYQDLKYEVESLKANGQLEGDLEKEFIKERTDFISKESARQEKVVLNQWGNEFYKQDPTISPLRGALASFGLSVDDIGVASFHGTSTKANDKNESEVVDKQLRHLGRSKGNALPGIFQKYLTGHPKGAAAAWMFNGVLQVLQTGIIPGNRNADNIDSVLKSYEYVLFPSRSIHTDGVKAGILKSFGFGQVGGEVLVIHPDYLFTALSEHEYEAYKVKNASRQAASYRYFHNSITGVNGLVQVKNEAPYTNELETPVYLNPKARATYNKSKKSYHFVDAKSKVEVPTTDALLTQDILSSIDSTNGQKERGVGVDVELISAINVDNETFIERNYTSEEIQYCNSRPDPKSSFAGKWAAKEAVIKAISSFSLDSEPVWTQGAGAPLKDIEILIADSNAPKVILHNEAAQAAAKVNVGEVKVSISHSGQYAIAMAVAK